MKHALKMVLRALPAGLAIMAFVAADGLAAEAMTQGDIYSLGEVVVSEADAGVEAVGTIHTVTAQEIEERGVRTLDEAIALLPGISIRTANDGTPRIDIRGFRTRHVQLLLDGIPLNSTLDGQFDPANISVENIAEIKVTTGGGSVLYGEGGNAGVINIITKKGQPGMHGSVGFEAREGDGNLGRFSLSGGNETVDAFVSGSVYDQDGFLLSDHYSATDDEGGDLRDNSDRKRQSLFANLGWAPSLETQLGLTVQSWSGEYGIPAVANYSATDPFTKKPKYDRVDDQEGYATQLAFDQQLNGPFSTRGWVYFNREDLEENRYDDDEYNTQIASGASHTESTTETAGINLQLKADLEKRGAITLALMGDDSDWQADGFEIVKVGKTLESQDFDLQRDLQVYTAALQYEVQPLEKLGFVFGLGQHYQHRDDHSQENDYSYEAGAHYDLYDDTRLRASYARKIRFPSIRQLYDVDSGNSDLTAETTLHYEMGIEQNLPAETLVSLTGFIIDAEDFIEKDDVSELYENYEEYRFKGFEVAAENSYVDDLLVRVSYSYLDSEDRSSGSEKDELQYRPRDKFTVEGRYRFPWGMTASTSLLYVGHQFFYDSDDVDPLQKKELDSYAVVDVKLSQDLLNKQLALYVGASNLFDEDYEQSYGLPQPGRTLYAGAEYRF